MWAAILIYICFSFVDFFLIPDVLFETTVVRLIAGAIAFLVTEAMHRAKASSDTMDDISGLIIVGCYLLWLFTAAQSIDITTLSYYFIYGVLFMMVSSLFFDFPTHVALRTSLTVLAGGLMSAFWLPGTTQTYLIAISIFYMTCFAAISYVNWKLERERYQVFLNALQAEIGRREVERRGNDLLALSRTDPLTGLYNRRATDEKLEGFWQDWLQNGQSFAVLLIDVDYFKAFNDHYGHQDGDQCLVTLAEVFRGIAESNSCFAGRYGGEEFIFLMGAEDPGAIVRLAESIRTAVLQLGLLHEKRPDGRKSVTVSIGSAMSHTSQGDAMDILVLAADQALYRAKDKGRNRIEIFDPSNPPMERQDEDIAALLDRAIDSGLVSMVYQPIVDIETGRTFAMESLMRLERPNGGAITPNVFIPIAESTGHIVSLGRWALLSACRDVLAENLAQVVSVNVSVIQLKTPGFSLYTAALIGRLKIDPKRLALEITESHAIDDHPEALNCIAELKRLGVKIWLDDFGAGYAGLSWLQKVEFDVVKIDNSFLGERMTARDKSMLSDLVRLIRHRGHEIVVEGVETPRQLEMLRSFDVHYAQGFYLGRPQTLVQLQANRDEQLASS
ncbi:hypothetical protein FP2506_03489 [Fulvimarina pelagi HTCC2506]|uniref:Uncharacterized protein n=2 Tax=Fulvimarina pelagi TaxID=217511 RepID=Q0G035_9HYPH|nr:hypothetical protein FP2506_03489 [Fulvimarina pelagi HTCC2506]